MKSADIESENKIFKKSDQILANADDIDVGLNVDESKTKLMIF